MNCLEIANNNRQEYRGEKSFLSMRMVAGSGSLRPENSRGNQVNRAIVNENIEGTRPNHRGQVRKVQKNRWSRMKQ